jgi:hypothetical protein
MNSPDLNHCYLLQAVLEKQRANNVLMLDILGSHAETAALQAELGAIVSGTEEAAAAAKNDRARVLTDAVSGARKSGVSLDGKSGRVDQSRVDYARGRVAWFLPRCAYARTLMGAARFRRRAGWLLLTATGRLSVAIRDLYA